MNSIKNLSKLKTLSVSASRTAKCQLNGQQIRCINDKNLSDKEKEKLEIAHKIYVQFNHSAYVKQFGLPNFRNRFFSHFYVQYRMSSIDPKFNKDQFVDECKEASMVFCNMVSNFKEDQGQSVKELMTSDAYEKLLDYVKDAPDDFLEKLKISDQNIKHFNLIFMRDYKKDDRLFVESTFSILMKPNIFAEDLGPELQGVPVSTQVSDLILMRYLRDYTDGENSKTDWLISYFDTKFVRPINFEEFNDIFKFKK